jgi:hypothetical protein
MYYFLHVSSGRSWPTNDPHAWLLDNHDDPLLAAARERLVASPDDSDRCLRVALRRCGLALAHVVTENRLVIQHWTEPPDLRVWAKKYKHTKSGIEVLFNSVKTGKIMLHPDGHDLLVYGVRVGEKFPWEEYTKKYEQRVVEEEDDAEVAPGSYSNFGWPGIPRGKLIWKVLKSIWANERVSCLNCDVPLMFTSINWNRGLLSFRSASLVRHCADCRRRFVVLLDEPLAWVAFVLPPSLRPTHLRQWRDFEINWSTLAFRHHRPPRDEGEEDEGHVGSD